MSLTQTVLEGMTIDEINEKLSESGWSENMVYEVNDSNLSSNFSSYDELFKAVVDGENTSGATWFRKDAYGHFIGFSTETDAKEYVIEIAKDLN